MHRISVENATLEIYDCEFRGDGFNSSFYISATGESNFVMKNTKLYSYVGWGSAVVVNSNNFLIENCEIVGGDIGITYNSSSSTIKGTKIINNEIGISGCGDNNLIEDNILSNFINYAIWLEGIDNLIINNDALVKSRV